MRFDALVLTRSATKNTLTLAKADKQELWGGEGGARERQRQNGKQRHRDGKIDRKTEIRKT